MFSVATFIIASSLLTKGLYSYLNQDSWVAVIMGYVISLMVISIYAGLSKQHPNQSIIEINDVVFGKIIGKFVSVCYIFYFLMLTLLNTRDMGSFVGGIILPKTPMAITIILFVIVCAWAVRKGAVNLTRYGTLFFFITIAAILINFALLIKDTQLTNFLPMFSMPLGKYFIGTNLVTALPFCEIFAFMMFIPHMENPDGFGKALKNGLTLGAITLLIVVLRDIAILGNYTLISTSPSFSVLRLIDIGDFLTRLEIVYAVILIALLFFKVSVLYYATVSAFARLLHFQSYSFLVMIFGALIVVYTQAIFESSSDQALWLSSAAAIFSTFFIFILPIVTLIVSAFRENTQTPRIAASDA